MLLVMMIVILLVGSKPYDPCISVGKPKNTIIIKALMIHMNLIIKKNCLMSVIMINVALNLSGGDVKTLAT